MMTSPVEVIRQCVAAASVPEVVNDRLRGREPKNWNNRRCVGNDTRGKIVPWGGLLPIAGRLVHAIIRVPMSRSCGATLAGRGAGMNTFLGRLAACFMPLVGAVTLTSADASYIPLAGLQVAEFDEPRRDFGAETDLYCVALAVYFEEGSTAETLDGQRHIARVVIERARADLPKWGGRELCNVVFYKRGGVCQFSFACLPLARRTPRGGRRWETAMAIASEELGGRSETSDNAIRYYMNPALTSDRNACRFRKEFIPVLEAGRHEFFREPTEAERRALLNSDPAECKRYKAALEARKRIAKAAAEKRRKAQFAKMKGKRAKYARK